MFEVAQILIFILIIAVFIGMLFFNKKAIVKRNLKNAPYISLQKFRSGETAKVIGKVTCVDEPLIAPLSGRKCAYYYIHVQQ